MNIEEYKNKLVLLSKQMQSFNPKYADVDPKFLNRMFKTVYSSGVLDIIHLEKEIQDQFKLELFCTLIKHSGALAFLVIQTLAANNIMTKNKFAKKDIYINKKCGIAINHLRAPKTIIEGIQTDNGYLLNGTLTWASGYKIFDTLVIGFHDRGFEKEVVSPFVAGEEFLIGNADETFVGYGLNTVNITLKNYFVKEEDIISSNKIGNYTKNKSLSKTVHFCIYGLGLHSLEYIKDKEVKENEEKKLLKIKEQFMNSTDINELDSLRVELFNSVLNTVTLGMIINGGSSVLLEKPLQRIYRELIMFNSNGLNNTLKSLFKEEFLKN